MMPIDGAEARRRIKAEYEKAQRDLIRARAQLEQFQTVDEPAFTQWLHRTFGALLTELRECVRRTGEAECLLNEIEEEAWFHCISHPAAYRRVLRRRQAAERRSARDDADDESPPHSKEDPFGNEEDWFEDTIPPGEEPHHRRPPSDEAKPGRLPHARLKELYRILARLLHPDSSKKSDAKLLEWWHRTQEAYEDGDVEQLETILALYEIDAAGHTAHTSLGLLQRITEQFKTALRDIRRQLRECRAQPAWNFSKSKTLWVLEGQVRHELSSQIQLLKHHLEEIQFVLATWRRPQRRSPRRSHRNG